MPNSYCSMVNFRQQLPFLPTFSSVYASIAIGCKDLVVTFLYLSVKTEPRNLQYLLRGYDRTFTWKRWVGCVYGGRGGGWRPSVDTEG